MLRWTALYSPSNHSLGATQLSSMNRMETTKIREISRVNDSVTPGSFTDKHVADDIRINAPRRNVCVSSRKQYKSVETWLNNVKSTSKPNLHFLTASASMPIQTRTALLKVKSDYESIHNTLKAYLGTSRVKAWSHTTSRWNLCPRQTI